MDWLGYVVIAGIVLLALIALAKREEHIATVRRDAQQRLAEMGFPVDQLCFGAIVGSVIAVDPDNARLAISQSDAAPLMFDFADLVAVEVMQNDSSVTKTNRGSQAAGAALGALLLGPAGLLLGGLTGSKRSIQLVDKLSLKIYVNDLKAPVHEIIFFNKPKSDPNSTLVKESYALLDEWHGRLRAILHLQNDGPQRLATSKR